VLENTAGKAAALRVGSLVHAENDYSACRVILRRQPQTSQAVTRVSEYAIQGRFVM